MRGGNDDAGSKSFGVNKPGDAWGRDDACRNRFAGRLAKALRDSPGNVRAGFTRVHADEDGRLSGRFLRLQEIAERLAGAKERRIVEGILAGDAADAISAEKFLGHKLD